MEGVPNLVGSAPSSSMDALLQAAFRGPPGGVRQARNAGPSDGRYGARRRLFGFRTTRSIRNLGGFGEIPCYPSLAELPKRVDQVVFGVGNERIEASLDEAIAHGARAATIFASCAVPGDGGQFRDRIAGKARAAGMAICGGNCMGFYNNAIGLRIAGYPALQPMPAGPIGWLAHQARCSARSLTTMPA